MSLIEQVGGIEIARRIIEGSPNATGLLYLSKGKSGLYFKEFQNCLYFWNEEKYEWVKAGFDSIEQHESFDSTKAVKLTDLRPAIAEHDRKTAGPAEKCKSIEEVQDQVKNAGQATVAEVPGQKLHWYLIGYSWKNNVCHGDGSFFRWRASKYEQINKAVVADMEKYAISTKADYDNGSLSLFINAVSYLGEMTDAEFKGEDHRND